MAKIIKKIILFIPILVIFNFSIKSVYAATLRSDDGTFYNLNIWTSSTIPSNYNLLANITRNDFPIDFVYKNTSSFNYNYIKFYDKISNNYWLFLFYNSDSIINKINYSTSLNSFTDFNCIPRKTCDDNKKSFWFFYISNDEYSYNQCLSYFNTFGFNLSDPYACQVIKNFKSSNNFIYRITEFSGYNSSGLSNLINNIKNYEIEMPEGNSFYIDDVQIFPTPDQPTPDEPTPDQPTPPEETINLDKIYVPHYEKGQCVEIRDKDTLRVFEDENAINYTDYFINSHYLSKEGQVSVSYKKKCSSLEFTSIGYYRNDFPEILFMVGSLSLFSIGFIFILFKRFRKR